MTAFATEEQELVCVGGKQNGELSQKTRKKP